MEEVQHLEGMVGEQQTSSKVVSVIMLRHYNCLKRCDSCIRKGATCIPAENTARCVRCRDMAIGCSRVSLERRYRATTLCGLQRSGNEVVDALINELHLDCRRKRKKESIPKPRSGGMKQSVGSRRFIFRPVGTTPPPRNKIFEDDPPDEELRNKVIEVVIDSDSDDLEMEVSRRSATF